MIKEGSLSQQPQAGVEACGYLFDEIKGMPNRAVLMQIGEVLFQNAIRKHIDLSVALIKVDGFDAMVLEHGHEAGVRALNQVGSTLTARFQAFGRGRLSWGRRFLRFGR